MGWGPGPTARLFGLFFRAKLCPFFLRILACRGSFFFSLQVWWRDDSGCWTEGTGLRALGWGQFFFSPCRYGGGTALETGLRALDWGHWAEGIFFFSLQVWWRDGSGCWTEGTGLRALGWGHWGWGHWAEGTGLRVLDWGHWAEGTGLRALGWGYWTEGILDWGNWTMAIMDWGNWLPSDYSEVPGLRDQNWTIRRGDWPWIEGPGL